MWEMCWGCQLAKPQFSLICSCALEATWCAGLSAWHISQHGENKDTFISFCDVAVLYNFAISKVEKITNINFYKLAKNKPCKCESPVQQDFPVILFVAPLPPSCLSGERISGHRKGKCFSGKYASSILNVESQIWLWGHAGRKDC